MLAEATSVREFRKGEVIVRQGELLAALMMVRAGVIVMRHEDEDAGRLAPGDFFGETGLLAGIGEAYTLEALTRVTVYEIDQQAFAPLLMNARPWRKNSPTTSPAAPSVSAMAPPCPRNMPAAPMPS